MEIAGAFSIATLNGSEDYECTPMALTSVWLMTGVVFPLVVVAGAFLDERDFFSSLMFGVISADERLVEVLTRGLDGSRGTGETGGESKC